MLSPILLPSVDTIDQWTELQHVQFVGTTPRIVPMSNFVQTPDEGMNNRLLSIAARIPVSSQIDIIKNFEDDIRIVEGYLVEFYCRRGLAQSFQQNDIRELLDKRPDVTKGIAKDFLIPLLNIFDKYKVDCKMICDNLNRLFSNSSYWSNGQYSDCLIDTVCTLIYKLSALEELTPSKPSLANDFSIFLKLLKGDTFEGAEKASELRMWIGNHRAITTNLLDILCNNLSTSRTVELFDIFYEYIRGKIEADEFLHPELLFNYISSIKFIFMLYERRSLKEKSDLANEKKPKYVMKDLSADQRAFISKLTEVHTFVPLIFEFAGLTKDGIDHIISENFKKKEIKNPPNIPIYDNSELHNTAKSQFRQLSQLLSKMSTFPKSKDFNKIEIPLEYSNKICKLIPMILKNVSRIISSVRRLIIGKLVNPNIPEGGNPEKWSSYEYTMRKGFKSDELKRILLLLWVSRSTRELIQHNIPMIYQAISESIHHYIQNFAVNILPQSIIRNSDYKEQITNILESIRAIVGYFENEAAFTIKATSAKKVPVVEPQYRKGYPHVALVEMVRIQLQAMTNKGSPQVTQSGFIFKDRMMDEDDVKEIETFLDDSKYFIDLLMLNTTVNEVFDQSCLFFKEFYLDQSKAVFFPVKSSLPVVLSDYALQNYQKPELTGAMYFPLSIYDDAASKALRYLKSKFLYEEIKAEASICVMSISRLIAVNSFEPIRKFATLRSMTKSLAVSVQDVIDKQQQLDENVSSIRLGVIVQQNQLSILGCSIDTKSLISGNINDLVHQSIQSILELTFKHGLLAIPMMTRLFGVMKDVHGLFIGFGLPLLPFNDLFRLATSMDTPNSLYSRILFSVSNHMVDSLISDFYLLTNPNRLIPKSPIIFNITSLFHGNIGVVMQKVLKPILSLVSIESFKELFWIIDDGSISIIHQQLVECISEVFSGFISKYFQLSKQIKRIKNSPMSMNYAQVFDRFEGAYRYFIESPDIDDLFQSMSQLGNILAISEMMDHALVLKRTSHQQVSSFLLSNRPTDVEQSEITPELFELYDNEFKQSYPWFDSLKKKVSEKEIEPPFLTNTIKELAKGVYENISVFSEHSSNILDVQSMTSFAAIWSVLEFIYVLIETNSLDTKIRSLIKYGEGVHVFAAALLSLTDQYRLYRSLSIGGKLVSHVETDFASNVDVRVTNFFAVHKFCQSALTCSLSSFEPIVAHIKGDK